MSFSEPLQEIYGIDGHVLIQSGQGDLTKVLLRQGHASAEVYLHGAHITSYKPGGRADVLWLSPHAIFESDKAIRGGIPLCWPWFGPHETDSNLPQHGYARTSEFTILSADASDGETRLSLGLDGDAILPPGILASSLRLEFEVRLSDRLWMELRTRNVGSHSQKIGAALHSYFAISDRGRIEIPQIKDLFYLDKTKGYQKFQQSSSCLVPTTIQEGEEIDRIYLDAPSKVDLIDRKTGTNTAIHSSGCSSLVVWNPGVAAAQKMADFPDDLYESMVCVEPAVLRNSCVNLGPGESYSIGQSLYSRDL